MLNIYEVLNTESKNIYHPCKKKVWQGEYGFSGRDNYSCERWYVWIKDLIEEMFNEKILRIYKF